MRQRTFPETEEENWFVYDSMNNETNCQATSQIFRLLYPQKQSVKVNLVNVEQQIGSNDCGLFIIAYAQFLATSREPAYYKFNQSTMREKFNYFAKYNYLEDFDAVQVENKVRNVKSIDVNC